MVGAVAAGLAGACVFRVPADDSTCNTFNLTNLARTYSANDTRGYQYYLNPCGDIPAASAPPQCAGLGPAAGYQLVGSDCYVLGRHNQTYVGDLSSGMDAPADWSDSPEAGVKALFSGGTPSGGEPRRAIVRFICDPHAGTGAPVFNNEQVAYHYAFDWRTSDACSPVSAKTPCPVQYEASWDSLSMRTRPSWFDDVKFGIFLHWGMYSVPAFKTEWYVHQLNGGQWGSSHAEPQADFVKFHNENYGCSGVQPEKYPCEGPEFKFADFAKNFKAEMFDPTQWATLFKDAGAKYVVLTSKHHEGFCLWPSAEHWNWNSVDIGPHRDLVGDLAKEVRAAGLTFGVYHSQREWYHPFYLQDNDNNCSTTTFVDEILLPTYRDLVNKYQPDVFWADGAGDAPCTHDSVTYWKAPEIISWMYNNAPNKDKVIVNSRWGSRSGGDYNTGGDRFTPGSLLPYKWESCFTVQRSSWGYDRTEDISSYFSTHDLLYQLVDVVSTGGNLLLNVGPSHDGRIMPAFQDRLLGMGKWLKVNGDAIYGTRPWVQAQNDTAARQIMYTQGKGKGAPVYAISFEWPKATVGVLTLRQPRGSASTKVSLMGYGDVAVTVLPQGGLNITVPKLSVEEMPCDDAWVFVLSGLQ